MAFVHFVTRRNVEGLQVGAGKEDVGQRGVLRSIENGDDAAGLKRIVALEPKPGVPPSAGYLAQVVDTLQKTPAKFVIRSAYEDSRPSLFIADKMHITAVVMPFTVGGTPEAKDLFTLFDDTINRLLAAAKG